MRHNWYTMAVSHKNISFSALICADEQVLGMAEGQTTDLLRSLEKQDITRHNKAFDLYRLQPLDEGLHS